MQHQHIRSSVSTLPGVRVGNRINPHVYTFGEIAQQLGLFGRSPQYRTAYVRTMIDKAHFPPPLPRFNHSHKTLETGADAVTSNAIWQRAAVDAWFNGLLPPEARAVLAGVEAEGTELDNRAANINALVQARGA